MCGEKASTAPRSQQRLPLALSSLLLPALLLLALSLLPYSAVAQTNGIIYVDADASGAGDGSSWTNAYTTLQDALTNASDGNEIWVAAGVYTPGITENDTFSIPAGVSLYGGFAGGETEREQRDWEANPTVLSGDIGGDDGADSRGVVTDTAHITGNNVNHVLTLNGTTTPITASTRIDGVIITAGQANGAGFDDIGGGLYCNGDGATSECSPMLVNVTFSGNWANSHGGAMFNSGNHGVSSPLLINVLFSGNSAGYWGGAMYNFGGNGESSPTLTNVTFSGNRAGDNGGAMYNYGLQGESSPILTNVTFAGNWAELDGGAMFNNGFIGESSPTLTNVILWNNSAGELGDVMFNDDATVTITHSLVQGGWDGSGIHNSGGSVSDGGGNIAADPLFVTLVNPDDAPTTAGDLRLLPGSPAIDAGDNSALPAGVTTDLDGNPRLRDSFGSGTAIVDMGAYEFQLQCADLGNRLYVDGDATGADDGSSWADAFTRLRDALDTAGFCGNVDEIWIAEGIYTPGASRSDSFNIPPGVAVYGGFTGDETERDQRDWEANPTVLSGDIDGNDTTDSRGVVTDTANINGDNAYHVLTLNGTSTPITASTRIDGVIITAGQADGSSPNEAGGGLYCNGDGATGECSPMLVNVTFSGNWAKSHGGAMFNSGHNGVSSPLLTNVLFSGNSAGSWGGAMFNFGRNGESSPTLTNVTFSGNRAVGADGGAMYNNGIQGGESSPTLTNVTFSGNRADEDGGAMYNHGQDGESSPTLTNVIFSGNWAELDGGAIYNLSLQGVSSPALTNVTFSGNRATGDGGAIYNNGYAGESNLTLTNVILWNNSAGELGDVMFNDGATVTIAHSLVQGGLNGSGIHNSGGSVSDGGGNIDADPLFMTPVNPDDAPTTDGDLRLQPGSPAIDAGDNSALPAGVTTDLAGGPRIQGSVVDMGAYEHMTRLYVDEDATGENNGSSWDDAFTTLQDALRLAHDGSEVWVAEGVYTPGVSVNDTFDIPPGVSLYGGFAGGENELEERKWEDNPTVLSGDIDGDDTTDSRGVVTDTAKINGNNAYHVLTLDGTTTPITASTRIDGVIITAGQADDVDFPDNSGGGLFCNGAGFGNECSPTLTNVTFAGNSASYGGAMFNAGTNDGQSSPTLTNVTFSGNRAGSNGGAMFNTGTNDGQSSPTLTNVTFSGNRADGNGGAMFNYGQSGESSPLLTNVTFSGNRADSNGGAMFNHGYIGESSPTLTNVTFNGNLAERDGGAMYNFGDISGQSSPTLTNVILWDNSAGDSGDVMYNDGPTPTIAHSLVQGGLNGSGIDNGSDGSVTDGGGNIDANPLFMTPVNPADAPTTAGDLRLQPGSPAIDAGDNSALPAGVTTDLDGNPRLRDGDNDGVAIIDMGAYEFTSPLITVELAPASVVEDSGQALTVTFTRTQNSMGELVVAFDVGGAATFGEDYVQSGATSFDGSSGSLTFGDGVLTRTMHITPMPDFVAELDETVVITVSASSSYSVSVPSAVTGIILDDDHAAVIVDPTGGLTTTESGGTATFSVLLQSEPTDVVTVTVASSDPGEGVVSSERLTFHAANWETPQTVTVTGVDDDEHDGDVTYTIELVVSSDDPFYDGIAAPTITVTNLDDDDPPPSEYRAYLPLLSGPPPGLPDLVVDELTVSGDGVAVVIANVGESAVTNPFWVDVYIDPDPAPTAPNQTWPLLASEGLVWGITDDALPLQPGASLTLTIGDAYYVPAISNFSGTLPAGTPLYAQVDSAHSGSDHGAVLEAHEADGGAYNNVTGPRQLEK